MRKQLLAAIVVVILCFSQVGAEAYVKGAINPLLMNYASAERKSKWERNTVAVCWENPDPAMEELRLLTKAAVQESWEKVANIKFTEWIPCTVGLPGIHIFVGDVGPKVEALGRYLDVRPNGMKLNFSFETIQRSCQESIRRCVRIFAVHEFGHALGFAHEQNREDAPEACQQEAQGQTGDWKVTEYDPVSVMNYCNKNWLGNGELSKMDIEAVQTLYGVRTT